MFNIISDIRCILFMTIIFHGSGWSRSDRGRDCRNRSCQVWDLHLLRKGHRGRNILGLRRPLRMLPGKQISVHYVDYIIINTGTCLNSAVYNLWNLAHNKLSRFKCQQQQKYFVNKHISFINIQENQQMAFAVSHSVLS